MTSAAPFVSILVPVKDGALYLRESLDSLLAQTWHAREIIVLDDASTDATPEILASYGPALRTVRQSATLGIYDNVNTGLPLARGDLVAVYHADDVYLPTIVEREIEAFRAHPEVGAVFCLDTWIDAQGREYGRLELPPDIPLGRPLAFAEVVNALLARKNIFLVCPTSMVRAELYRRIGGYRQSLFKNSSDLDCWLRLAREAPLLVLPEYLVRYRHFHGSSSHRYHHMRTEPERTFAILDHHLAAGAEAVATSRALREYEAHRAEDLLLIAATHYIQDDRRAMRRRLAQVSTASLARGRNIQRGRLLLLRALLQLLASLPRAGFLADAFYRRWHARRVSG